MKSSIVSLYQSLSEFNISVTTICFAPSTIHKSTFSPEADLNHMPAGLIFVHLDHHELIKLACHLFFYNIYRGILCKIWTILH